MNARTLSLITGLVTGLALAHPALAVSGCTNSYLFGNYAMQFSGVSAPNRYATAAEAANCGACATLFPTPCVTACSSA